jgi:hypothetical protein
MSLSTLAWISAIIFVIFYVQFIIESANEMDSKDGMATIDSAENDNTSKIRAKMERLERDNERMERLTKSASRVSDISQKWSPVQFIWDKIFFF